jgi:hydroxypyruvate reductase
MRNVLKEMFLQALRELDLPGRLRQQVWAKGSVLEIGGDLYALDQLERIRAIALGKAAAEMAAALDEALGVGRATGLVVSSAEPGTRLPNFRYVVGGHPCPTAASIEAANAALELAGRSAGECSLLIFLISGGGSALLEKPLFDDITLEQAAAFHRLLVTCGVGIYEMNVLRKHFSAVKGGRLALAAYPARQCTLYVSDVPTGKPSTIASGPTMPDESTVADCMAVTERYGLVDSLPAPYACRLRWAAERLKGGKPAADTPEYPIPETPKPGDPRFEHSRYYSVLSNQDGIDSLARQAAQRGWAVEVDLSCDDWPLEKAADALMARLRDLRQRSGKPSCVISGGELSSPVTGSGAGGRNQAFALYCATKIAGEKTAMLSAGTDGIDGNSPAAGATACGSTLRRAAEAGLDPLAYYRNSDSYSFFEALGDAIVTGPTGNNVRDLRVLVAP